MSHNASARVRLALHAGEFMMLHPEREIVKPQKLLIVATLLALAASLRAERLPTLEEALASREDAWGVAAMRQRNGPSREFFEKLLPPLRYVNAAFRHYPIVLSAPGAPVKARLVSNGSALNARAKLGTWHEVGVPVAFRVQAGDSDHREPFGQDLRRLTGPKYERGHLPVVQLGYEFGGVTCVQECFASTDPELARHGVIFLRFDTDSETSLRVSAAFDSSAQLEHSSGTLRTADGAVVAWCSANWRWDPATSSLEARVSTVEPAVLAVATKSGPLALLPPVDVARYAAWKTRAVETWTALISRAMQVETPERYVNDASRALLVQNYALLNGDEPRYSAGNAYDRLYAAECGDVATAFLLWGFGTDVRRMLPPLLAYSSDALVFHNAGTKLQTLARFYWLQRDRDLLQSTRTEWNREVTRIVEGREPETGLPPREKHCGDIDTKVYALHAMAAAWRGLRDMSAVLADGGERDEADRLKAVAADFRKRILAAVEKSIFPETQPPFVPIALFGEEKPHDPLTATMLGSYWNLLAPYVLDSQVFGHGSPNERAMLDYLHAKGGVFMGMIRFHQHSGLFANEDAVDDLYGLRYASTLLRLDEVERALVSFYGKLAQGMTRDTFIGAEGTGLRPLDPFGRPMYLPPNSTANAHFLHTFRNLLVQDWDLDDDGVPETLRLLFAIPRKWLEDGKEINVTGAPTAFGRVSVRATSKLQRGEVLVDIAAPERQPKRMHTRVRLPDGWKVTRAQTAGRRLEVDSRGTIDISGIPGRFILTVTVAKE